MHELTPKLLALQEGEPLEPQQLLPLVYDELRRLAVSRLKMEKSGQTLQATERVPAHARAFLPMELGSQAS
jgi:hypothetical protein